ncbi:pilus (MSHA type) biogenesis protein MshL [Natronospirillum operosum]|uniref:Pilus (MSHA type) biogenesis protein MshL n=1 Tax=Natronospirillum operosum TaxID=2759953 RepID=A0A4Z0WC13_9GAMM|nr:pilus (MSHA type) biogenesis protein MshL [Natronospirillum operosum]TGG92349.1 pilus (MSHA type) biogenesis protein MshL [Natronospirillum operosum]
MTSCYATPSFRLRSGLPLLVLSLLLAGCASSGSNGPERETRSTPSAPERMASQLDEVVPDARAREPAPAAPPELGAMLLDSAPQTTNRFDVAASDVELAQFLDDLSEVAQTNILLDSSVSGTVSLRLRDVTIRDVMQALQDQLGIAFERTDYGYRVSGDQLQTRMFRVNYLDIQRSGLSSTGIGGSQIGGGESQGQLSTRNETDFWGTLESTLGMMMGQGGDRQLVINRQTGLIVVKAPPSELRAISDFLYEAEIALQQQVIIEARVLEVRLSDTFESGIDWSILGQDVGDVSGLDIGAGVSGNTGSNDPDLGGAFNLSLNLRNFNSVLSALRTQGEVEVLSSPRISTVNNQKAVIKVGSEEQFVNVSSVATTSDDGQQQINPNFSLQPYFSGIILDVTPQIAHDDQIILHVHPSVVQVTASSRTFTIQGESYNLPVASSSIRETDSVIRADNGQVVVIGGLLQNSITSLRSGLPGEGGGWLRRLLGQERTTNERTELIILLRPVIADADSFEEDIRNTSTRLLNR